MSLAGGTKRSQSNAADAKMYELVKFPWTFINDVTNMTPIPMVRNAILLTGPRRREEPRPSPRQRRGRP